MDSQHLTQRVIEVLNTLEIPYMLVGGLSVNFYSIPRSTKDADFVFRIQGDQLHELAKSLRPDLQLNSQMSFETNFMTTKHEFHSPHSAFIVEIFDLSDDPFDQSRFDRRIWTTAQGQPCCIPTAEDVLIQKLRWKRQRDQEDIKNILVYQDSNLDWKYINSWCEKHDTKALLDEIRSTIPKI